MDLKENERLDDLQIGGLKIIQDKTKYCFTSDSAILANFVSAKKSDKVCELGAGTGVISILLTYKQNPEKIYAFEVQKETAELAKRNVDLNLLNDKIEIINSPIQDFEKYVKRESFNVVVSNPPYRKVNEKSLISLREEEAISKHEVKLNLDELVSCAKNLLKFGGKFFLVYDATRTAELIYKLKQNNLEPKTMFFTSPSPTKNPVLVLIEAVKGGKEQVNVLPTLITNDKDGNYIYTIQNLYRKK